MLKIIGILCMFVLLSCSQSGQQNESNSQVDTAKTKCDNSVAFGDIDICLPTIDGMTECYSEPFVKSFADKFEYEGITGLAFYLNNDNYKQVDSLGKMAIDDYFKINAPHKLKGIKFGESEMNEMAESIEKSSMKENWSVLKKKIEKAVNYMSIGRPILIESYTPSKKVRTFLYITKFQTDDYEEVVLISSNFIQIKDRCIWMSYYKNYEGEESIKKTKAKNDYIVFQLLDENN